MTAGRAARRLAPFAVHHHPNRGRTLQWPVGRTCEGVESMHVENICSNTPRAMHLSRFMRPQVRQGRPLSSEERRLDGSRRAKFRERHLQICAWAADRPILFGGLWTRDTRPAGPPPCAALPFRSPCLPWQARCDLPGRRFPQSGRFGLDWIGLDRRKDRRKTSRATRSPDRLPPAHFTLEGRACLRPRMTGDRSPHDALDWGAFLWCCAPPACPPCKLGQALTSQIPNTHAHTGAAPSFLLGSKAGKRGLGSKRRRRRLRRAASVRSTGPSCKGQHDSSLGARRPRA